MEAQKKVLVVEDERDVAGYLEMVLQDAGYQTQAAPDGDAAIEAVRTWKPDLVTLDISMPKASGTRFYRELRSDPEIAHLPVVIVTAVTGYAGDPRGYEKFLEGRRTVPPPEGFFSKPLDRDAFLEAVRGLLDAPAATSI